jgi:hypothetical protein
MARNRFVTPGITRLPLSDGDWIDVKKELNAGEQRAIFTDLVKEMVAGEKPHLDPKQVGKTKLMQYIVAWSFADAKGDVVPFSEGALENLDPDTYGELVEAVDAHEETAEKVRAERKNDRSGESTSKAISLSAAG